MKFWMKSLMIGFLVLLITAFPLMYLKNADFGGADGKAEAAITEIDEEYKPWIKPFFEPGSETESMLFALQAAIGAGVIGFAFGRLSTRKKSSEMESNEIHSDEIESNEEIK